MTLAQVYAAILYYLENPESVGRYLADWLDYTLNAETAHDQYPPAIVERLQQIRASRVADQIAV